MKKNHHIPKLSIGFNSRHNTQLHNLQTQTSTIYQVSPKSGTVGFSIHVLCNLKISHGLDSTNRTQPNSVILISFYSEENVLSNEAKTCNTFGLQNTGIYRSAFWEHPVKAHVLFECGIGIRGGGLGAAALYNFFK